ncbi:MAG: hypothetical protein AMXMBFR64_05110 [Myxococcales bacterium]
MAARGDVSLTVRLTGEDQASSAIRDVEVTLSGLGRTAMQSARDWADAYNEINGAVSNVLGKLRAVGDVVRQGQEAANANTVFARTWQNSANALEMFREATQGTIDDTTMQQRSRSMAMLGLSAEETASALASSFKIAAATGKQTDQVLEQVLGGIRGRAMGLKALGVELDFGGVYRATAEAAGKATTELTALEKRVARTSAVLQEMDAVAGKVALDGLSFSVERADTAWTNLKSNLQVMTFTALAPAIEATAVATGALADEVGSLTGKADDFVSMTKALRRQKDAAEALQDPMIQIGVHVAEIVKSGAELHVIDTAIRAMGNAAMLSWEDIQALKLGLRGSIEAGRELGVVFDDLAERARDRSLAKLLGFGSEAAQIGSTVARAIGDTAESVGDMIAKRMHSQKRKKGAKGGEGSLLDESDLLVAGLYGTVEGNMAAFRELTEAVEEAADEAYATATAETARQRGLWEIRHQIELEGRRALLDEDDALGQIALEHELRLQEIRRTSIDHEQADLLTQLENQRFAAEEREALRDRELDSLKEAGSAIADAAEQLRAIDQSGVGAGLGKAAGFVAQNWEKLSKGQPAAIAALGNVSAAGIKSEAALAAIRVIMELAAGTSAAVTPGMQWAAAGHFSSAALYAVAEGMGGGGGGGSRSTPATLGGGARTARVAGGQGTGGTGGGDAQPTIINYGVIGMGGNEASKSLNEIIARGVPAGLTDPGAGRY